MHSQVPWGRYAKKMWKTYGFPKQHDLQKVDIPHLFLVHMMLHKFKNHINSRIPSPKYETSLSYGPTYVFYPLFEPWWRWWRLIWVMRRLGTKCIRGIMLFDQVWPWMNLPKYGTQRSYNRRENLRYSFHQKCPCQTGFPACHACWNWRRSPLGSISRN